VIFDQSAVGLAISAVAEKDTLDIWVNGQRVQTTVCLLQNFIKPSLSLLLLSFSIPYTVSAVT